MSEINTKVFLGVPKHASNILNGGFENMDGADDFSDWTEVPGNGAVEEENTIVLTGDNSVKISSVAGAGVAPSITQAVTVSPGDSMVLSFWSRGDDATPLFYNLIDVTNAGTIKNASVEKSSTWTRIIYRFEVPAGCVSIRLEFWGFALAPGNVGYIDEVYLWNRSDLAWTENLDVEAHPAPTWDYGIAGTGPSDLVAGTGAASFFLDNGATPGKYSPEHKDNMIGFEEGMAVKITVGGPDIDPIWNQQEKGEGGDLSEFDAVSPAWDGEVDVQADFDAQTDADGDMNDTVAAMHDGTTGLEFTFDDANGAYGKIDFDAVNQTSGVVSFWFDPNDVAIEASKEVRICCMRDGAGAAQATASIYNAAGTYKIYVYVREDGGGWQYSSLYAITMDYAKYDLVWKQSSGADDGYLRLYIDDVLIESVSGIDNDTKDVDYVNIGMFTTTSTTFGGSFYLDTIKVDPVGAPMASTPVIPSGGYGMVVPIMDTTARYGSFTDPTTEITVTAECWLDPNALVVGSTEEFAFIYAAGAFSVQLGNNEPGSALEIYATADEDGGSDGTSYYEITDAVHHIRVEWMASTGAGVDDGSLRLYIDNVLMETLSGLDNDTLTVGSVWFGACTGLDAGTYGIFYMDGCKWSDNVGRDKFVGTIKQITPTSGEFDNPVTEVIAHDWMGYANKQMIGVQAAQVSKRGDEALTTLLAEFQHQPEATDFDTGDQTFLTVFQFASDTSSMASYFQKICRNEQGRIYCEGDGTLVFEAGTTRAGITTSAFTIDGTMSNIEVNYITEKMYNKVVLLVRKTWTDVAATSELWIVGDLGIPIVAGETITLICKFRDADTGQLCAGSTVVTPVAAPHFGSTQVPANDDMHASLTDDNYVIGGTSLSVDLTNTHGANTGYVNEFTILGRRIVDEDRATIEAEDTESILQVGENRFTERLDLIVDPHDAYDIASDIVDAHGPSHTTKARIVVLANLTSTLADALAAAEVSTRFTAIESVTGISKDFFINRISYRQDNTLLWVTIDAEEV